MPNSVVNRSGNCPYCDVTSYDSLLTEERQPGQTLMRCLSCLQWSVRMRGSQYPLQDPSNKESSPTTVYHG